MIGLGAVSAVDETSFNETAIAANDNSQDLNLVDVNNANVDDGNVVDIANDNKNDELKAADDEDVLGANTTLEIINEKASYTQNDQITVKMGSYSMASESSDVDVYLNNDKIATTTYGVIHSNAGFTFSLSNAIIGENTVYCSGSSLIGSYTSDSVTFTVTEDSQSGNSSGGDESDIVLKVTDAYSKYDGQSSSMHFPYTDDYVFIATSGNNAKYNAVVTFRVEGASSSAKIKFGSTEQSISSGTATLEFNTDNLGENTIYVVDGSKKSNEVKVYIVSGQNKIASLSVDPEWGVEGQNITITPTAMSSGSSSADGYTSRPISGYVTFYSSSSYTDANRIATVSTDGGSFTVPLVDITAECDYIQLYYTFAGEYNSKGFIHSGSKYVYFLVLDSNPIALTGNGQTGEINPDSDNKVNLHVTPTYYMNDGTSSFMDVYVGTQKVGTFSAASTTSVNDYVLDFTGYDSGDYDVYVKYEGYNFEDTNGDVYYHAGNESNHLTVHIEGATPNTGLLTVSVTNTTYGNTVATVTAGQAGTYALKINGVDYNTGIVFNQAGSQEIPITGYAAGSSPYSATVVDNNDASLMNATTFTISKADANLQVTLTGNNTLLADTQTVTVSANGNGKVRINNGAEKDLGEITLDNLVAGMNTVVIDYAGDENYTSASQTIYVNVYDKYPSSVSIELNATGIAKGDSIKVTPTVTVNGNTVTSGSVAIYYENGNLIDTINLAENSYFVFTPAGEEGDTVSVYAKYLENNDLGYAESPNSELQSVKIKKHLTIVLTVDGKTSFVGQVATQQMDYSTYQYVYLPKYVFYADTNGLNLPVKVYDNDEIVSGTFTTDSDDDISLYFTSSEAGDHVVYVEFEGDDTYLPSKSNDVIFKILQTRTASGMELTPNSAVEGTKVSVTPKVYYQDYSSSKEYLTNGTLTLYSDYSKTNVIATINLGENGSFEYDVPAATSSPSSSKSFYWSFEGVNGDYYYSYASSSAVSFYSMKENEIELTGDGETGTIDVISGNNITLEVTLSQFYKRASDSTVLIYVDDVNVANFTTTYSSSQGSYTLNPYTFESSQFGIGTHKVYAVYEGYVDRTYYYAPGQSNNLTVNIIAPSKDTSLTLENTTPVNVDLGTTVTIQAAVLAEGENVLVGNISYYDNGVYFTNLTAGTPLDLSSLDIGEHVISAKYLGSDGYNPSNSTNNITVVINQPVVHTLKIDIATKQYPDELIAVITTSRVGNYTISVGSKTVNAEVMESDNGVKEVSLGNLTADNYEANIVCVEDNELKNVTSFEVTKGTLTFDVDVEGNNTVYGEGSKSIAVSTSAYNATGKFTYSGDVSGEGITLDLSNLANGTYNIVIEYSDDVNYNAESKTVTFVVLEEFETQTSITISPNTIIKGQSIIITPTVTANNQNVEAGQVEIWDGETLIATIDLATNKNYTYTPNKAKGTYSNAIFARYIKNETLKLGASESGAETYIIVLPEVTPTVTLEINTTEVLVNGKILITPHVVDSEGKEINVGTVTIGKDLYGYNDIARINAGESYVYTVDSNSHNPYNNSYNLYARYNGAEDENITYKSASTDSATKYYHVYSNSLTLTASDLTIYAGQSVDLSASVNGNGVITLFVGGVENTTMEKDTPVAFTLNQAGDYVFQASYAMTTSDYYASCESQKVTVHVLEVGTPVVEIELDKDIVSKDGAITVTPSVVGASVDKGIVEFYDENNNLLGSIDLNTNTSFTFTVTGEAGSSHSVWAKYIDANTVFPEVNSTKKDYKIKGILTITLTRNGEGLVKPGDSVGFTITFSDAVSDNLELWINDSKINDEDGSASTSITFDETDIGLNNVFIKFLGNDEFEACVSNNVTVNVVEPVETTTTLEINTTDILADGKILITPKVVDSNGNTVTVGTVTIGKDLYGYNDIASINVGETYEYAVDSNEFNPYNNPYFLYARYSGASDTETIFEASQTASRTRYYHIYSNTLTLTVNGETEVTAYVGSEVNFLATLGNGEGRIVIVDKDGIETEITAETPIKFDAIGDFTYYAKFTRANNSYYASVESSPVTVHVIQKETNEITVSVESITLPGDVTVQVTATKAGNYTVKINDTASTEIKVEVKADGETGSAIITLAKGNYSAVVDYTSDIYNVIVHNTTFEVVSISAGFNATATPSEVEVGNTVKINTSVKIMGATGDVTVILPNGTEIKAAVGEEVKYNASEAGEKTFTVKFDSSNGYLSESITLTVKVNEKKPIDLSDDVLNIITPSDGSNPVFSVDLPTKENGTLFVTVNNKTYNGTVLNGKGCVEVPGLDVGEYNATVVFVDQSDKLRANKTVGFAVPKEDVPADKAFNITSPTDSTSPTFSMDLPGATGNFTVTIGNKTYAKELVDGKATITVDDLNPGEYNVTVSYSGDAKHSPISQNTTVNIPTPKLSDNKDINVVYSGKATYKVRVTVNGKPVVGQNVAIQYNGKTYNVKTDKNGYVTLNLKTDVKVKAYIITATYKGVKVSNKVTVKHLIIAKNLKIKKSKKVVKIKVKTNKVNGKFLKGKKLKLKLKGKTLKAKINKKGVATFKVKKNILKKLKVGKKYTYKVSYGKDSVSKKIKVKR